MTTFRVTLAEKPTDLLVHIVDNGPEAAHQIAAALGVRAGLYTGGLNVLRELGLAAPLDGTNWEATAEGRRLVEQAREASAPRDVSRCCGADVTPTGDAEGTVFYTCRACGRPTDAKAAVDA